MVTKKKFERDSPANFERYTIAPPFSFLLLPPKTDLADMATARALFISVWGQRFSKIFGSSFLVKFSKKKMPCLTTFSRKQIQIVNFVDLASRIRILCPNLSLAEHFRKCHISRVIFREYLSFSFKKYHRNMRNRIRNDKVIVGVRRARGILTPILAR